MSSLEKQFSIFILKLAEKFNIDKEDATAFINGKNSIKFIADGITLRLENKRIADRYSKKFNEPKIRIEIIDSNYLSAQSHPSARMFDFSAFNDKGFDSLIARVIKLITHGKQLNQLHLNNAETEKNNSEKLDQVAKILQDAGIESPQWFGVDNWRKTTYAANVGTIDISINIKNPTQAACQIKIDNIDSPDSIDKLKRIAAILAE